MTSPPPPPPQQQHPQASPRSWQRSSPPPGPIRQITARDDAGQQQQQQRVAAPVSPFSPGFPKRRGSNLASYMRTRSQMNLSEVLAGRDTDPDEPMASPTALRRRSRTGYDDGNSAGGEDISRLLADERRLSQILQGPSGPQARSMRLIGQSNPRYRWDRYWKHEDELHEMKKPLRKYYERTNELIQQYMYIDCLLDSSIPHDLLNKYSAELGASAFPVSPNVPETVREEQQSISSSSKATPDNASDTASSTANNGGGAAPTAAAANHKEPTPRDIFRSSETMPLLQHGGGGSGEDGEGQQHMDYSGRHADGAASPRSLESGPKPNLPWLEDAEVDSDHPIVTLAIYVNMAANLILLIGKIIVVVTVPSMSVLASLVDAALDFLSTAIIWTTTRLISAGQKDQYRYPVGRRRLEPVGVLVFSVIMVTAFVQVALESVQRLLGPDHEILELGIPAIGIMAGTVIIKGAVWVWCRLVKNSSVRALADDAMTDVIFNIGSILFPIVGFYARVWWLDALGGLLLSMVVIFNWSQTSAHHVRNLTGFSAQPDERNLLLYLTMRFATAIRQIQNLRAYHAGDKLFVEADIVLSADTPLKDSHDLSEVLTYFLESVPIVDRAFVHVDYASYNAPTHMKKQGVS